MKRDVAAIALLTLITAATNVFAQAVPSEYQQVLTTLGKQGDFKGNVLKVNIPRNDLRVTVAGMPTPTPFGFVGAEQYQSVRRKRRERGRRISPAPAGCSRARPDCHQRKPCDRSRRQTTVRL